MLLCNIRGSIVSLGFTQTQVVFISIYGNAILNCYICKVPLLRCVEKHLKIATNVITYHTACLGICNMQISWSNVTYVYSSRFPHRAERRKKLHWKWTARATDTTTATTQELQRKGTSSTRVLAYSTGRRHGASLADGGCYWLVELVDAWPDQAQDGLDSVALVLGRRRRPQMLDPCAMQCSVSQTNW
jgi:hypothetical protein